MSETLTLPDSKHETTSGGLAGDPELTAIRNERLAAIQQEGEYGGPTDPRKKEAVGDGGHMTRHHEVKAASNDVYALFGNSPTSPELPLDEARAAVDSASHDLRQQPEIGRKEKLRMLVGMNAYSKKKSRAMRQQYTERLSRFNQANGAYQQAFRASQEAYYEEWAAKEALQQERGHETRMREFDETNNEGRAQAGQDTLSHIESLIAHHETRPNPTFRLLPPSISQRINYEEF